ncbi:MAG TPA: methylated-DNA--[protein]-cysteine S-methyltransferase [Candidatus Nesterenkonia stercoripullorum]|uniref:Methylated-DNA--protein-cysteine methyltransferase n=1 Tax=Candidatus Nesterenkonia stercoripullorum TaxID=2838701 RepID=A0A9D1S2C7_9MICC|nr:methylated-DNA--[protein]-cysteine S-methyltransferase [Candidatus Nesterenkonia stercoripullorum]
MNNTSPQTRQPSSDEPRSAPSAAEPDQTVPDESLFPVPAADLERLRTQLERHAAAADLLDVAYRTVDTPLGALLLAATDKGLLRVAFAREGFDDVLATIAHRVSPRVLQAPARLDQVAREVDEYFAGTRRDFDIVVDHALSSGFRLRVQSKLPQIAYGRTLSYRELAELSGSPKAVRAVGSACATNPLPIVVPCHRVLRSDGGLGGYIGGLDAKTMLLELEKTPEQHQTTTTRAERSLP